MKPLDVQITKEVGRAIIEYGMIEEGDRVAVAVSGGKDSLTLLDVLLRLQKRAPIRFDLVAVTVDQGYEGFRWPVMERHFQSLGVPYHIENTRISDLIDEHKAPGATQCSLCARLRRGVLYGLAKEKGWSKIALGHHADDLIETLLLSQLYNGAIQSMPPILRADDGINVVIRPLCYVWEDQIVAFTKQRSFPVICCACTACTDLTLKRKQVKALLSELESGHPGIKRSLLRAHSRARVTQLMDPRFLPLGEKASLRAEIAQVAGVATVVESEPPEEEATTCGHQAGSRASTMTPQGANPNAETGANAEAGTGANGETATSAKGRAEAPALVRIQPAVARRAVPGDPILT